MSFLVTTALKKSYDDNVNMLTQQTDSRFENCVRKEVVTDSEEKFFDRIGPTAAQRRGSRHSDTPLISTPHDRRRVVTDDFNWADLIDKPDKLRGLGEVSSPYAQNAVMAFKRTMDDVIIEAMFGTAYAGKNGETPVAFPASQQVAVNYVPTGSPANSGLTIPKIIAARKILMKNNVDVNKEELYMGITAEQLDNLLNTTQVTSGDFNSVKALVDGTVTKFLGFNFVHSEQLLRDSNGYQRIPVWCKSGILLAVGQQITTDIDKRTDKNNSMQVYAEMTIGATRMEEVKVVEIKCLLP
jgi:hypothetical protein